MSELKEINCIGTLSAAENVAKNIIENSSSSDKSNTLASKEDDYAQVCLLEVEFINSLGLISSSGIMIELQRCTDSESHFEVRTELFDEQQGVVEVDTTRIASAHEYCAASAISRIAKGDFWRLSGASVGLLPLIQKKISFYISYIELSNIVK